jgi:hypothetical protein
MLGPLLLHLLMDDWHLGYKKFLKETLLGCIKKFIKETVRWIDYKLNFSYL